MIAKMMKDGRHGLSINEKTPHQGEGPSVELQM